MTTHPPPSSGPLDRSPEGVANGRRTLSSPPLSARPFASGALRQHEDSDLLNRTWLRLQGSDVLGAGRRRRALRVRVQLALAAAVFAAGVGVGRWSLPGLVPSQDPTVTSENNAVASAARAPAARSEQSAPAREDAGRRGRRTRAERSPVKGSRNDQARAPVMPEATPVVRAPVEEGQAPSPLERSPGALPEVERAPWLVLAERGDFAAAFAELDHDGNFQAVLQASSAEELMTLADVARFAGREARAILALRQVTERFRDDPNAPLAAMMLGNLLSRAGDREGAARAYALNRALSPDGDFAEDALVRELDLVLAERDLPRAAELLQKYETQFPEGVRLAALRAEVEALRVQLATESGEEPEERAAERRSDDEREGEADSADDSSSASPPEPPAAADASRGALPGGAGEPED